MNKDAINRLFNDLTQNNIEYQNRAHEIMLNSRLPAKVSIPLLVDMTRILYETTRDTATRQGYAESFENAVKDLTA